MREPPTLRRLAILAYLLVLVAISGVAHVRPNFNWDIAGYIGVVYAYEDPTPERVHEKTYGLLRRSLPAYRYEEFTGSQGNVYRGEMERSPAHFYEQLPFYGIRPLYTGALYGLNRLGLDPLQGSVWLAGACYWAIGLLLLAWVGLPGGVLGIAACGLLMMSAPLWDLAGLSSPDPLSTLIGLLAFYMLLARRHPVAFGCLMLAAVFARNDNVVLALLAFAYLKGLAPAPWRMGWRAFGGFSAAAIAAYFLIGKLAGNYGYAVVFAHTFHGYMVSPSTFAEPFTLRFYLQGAANSLQSLRSSQLPLFLAVGALGLIVGKALPAGHPLAIYRAVIWLIAAAVAVRAVLFPAFGDRFFFLHEIMLIVATLQLCLHRSAPVAEAEVKAQPSAAPISSP